MDKNGQKVKVHFSATTIAVIIALFGFILLLITSFDWKTDADWYIVVLYNILSCLGTTLLSVGLVSILVELSTIQSVVTKAIKSVYTGDVPLEQYSESHLKKLKNRISAHLLSGTVNKLQKSVYSLEPQLLELTNNLYYEYHSMNCDIYPDDSKGIFTKKIKIEYKIINEYNLENSVRLGLSLYNLQEGMTNDQRISGVRIKKFMVNKTDLINDSQIVKNIILTDVDDHYEYDYVYSFERPLQKCKEHTVILEYEYDTAQSDLTQSWKLKYPCKKIQHTVTIKGNNQWNLKANAFASFYHANSKLETRFNVEQSIDKCTKVVFDEWTIPGAGYVVSYNKS